MKSLKMGLNITIRCREKRENVTAGFRKSVVPWVDGLVSKSERGLLISPVSFSLVYAFTRFAPKRGFVNRPNKRNSHIFASPLHHQPYLKGIGTEPVRVGPCDNADALPPGV